MRFMFKLIGDNVGHTISINIVEHLFFLMFHVEHSSNNLFNNV
jgi:hypothetical protein